MKFKYIKLKPCFKGISIPVEVEEELGDKILEIDMRIKNINAELGYLAGVVKANRELIDGIMRVRARGAEK